MKDKFECYMLMGLSFFTFICDLIEYYTDEILTNKFIFFRGYLKKILVKYFVCYTEDIETMIYEILKSKKDI